MLGQILFFLLAVGVPVWDLWETRQLKTSTGRRAKVQTYQRIIAALWAMTLLAVASAGWDVWLDPRLGPQLTFLRAGRSAQTLVAGFCAGAAAVLLLPLVLALRKPHLRPKLMKQFARLHFFLPRRQDELRWFAAVCITAGICEEVLYRGFLTRYLTVSAHQFQPEIALCAGAVLFGLGHTYQGFTGMIATAILGLILGAIFLITGNLAVPIAIHLVIDLRAWFLSRWATRDD